MRWAQAAIEFLKSDIDGISQEFDLLSKGILDEGTVDSVRTVGTPLSRSIPVKAES
ncbi:hypothetical protein [Streptomyces gobiensis]|uniref:hypothetical protein n=1 Tax=Streptomyces gobiensis TaxID=2875706 RepID=UPI001E60B058|nr:hypothetical protein [Streptomyces gobiensis]UGY94764.1 hypothetical protein test1122_25530 [Streptomyces gobiensis]